MVECYPFGSGWRGTFNIVTDCVGKSDKYLQWEDVRELVRRGHEVTTHTLSHPNLVKLLDEGKTNEVRRQIAASRDLIAEKTGFAPRYMCSPYVRQNDATDRIAAMARAGVLRVTDCDGFMSDCALKAKTWPRHGVLALSFDDHSLADWERAFPHEDRVAHADAGGGRRGGRGRARAAVTVMRCVLICPPNLIRL